MPTRLAALEECRQAFAAFRAHPQTCEQLRRFLPEGFTVAELSHAAHEFLCCPQCFRPATQQLIDLSFDGCVELLCSRSEVQKTDAARFERIERSCGQEQASCVSIADRRYDVRRDDGRHDAEPHFSQRELRCLYADGNV